ncbi:single-stranded DNA-binding protein [Clostridium massiliamazoniense]|uniref:single-stranded DNA-binding protein n=1 Tax=Clostridium massiliamazoniense TaxID=1347366 RepID=UPI0006D7DAA8|nr:single-stranded DNA-binding protein [Clostridium massiliamazoniense]
MNKIVLSGQFVEKPKLHITKSGKVSCNFILSIHDQIKTEINYFINCIALNDTAKLILRLFKKNDSIIINGFIKSKLYKKNIYATTVVVQTFSFPID